MGKVITLKLPIIPPTINKYIGRSNIWQYQSYSSSYHLFGDSICTNCLMAIFGELLDIDWKLKLEEMLNKYN